MVKTYKQLLMDTRHALKMHGISNSSFEGLELFCLATGLTREQIVERGEIYAGDRQIEAVNKLVQRRLSGEPLQYIVGSWEFMSLTFEINPCVLIPRPDTEILVQAAIDVLSGKHSSPRLLDLCTGSGCVGISVLKSCPEARGILSDISEDAISVARRNVLTHGLSSRCAVVCADVNDGPKDGWGSFDVITANPPYIPSKDIETLDSSVRDFEPVLALDGGANGLKFYDIIARQFKPCLKQLGTLIFEIGINQNDAVVDILKQAGYSRVEVIKDYSGIERVLRAWL